MTDAPATPAPRRKPQPNYAARRMLVTTIAITAVVTIGLVGWRAVKGDSNSSTSASDRWDRIALVDRTTGSVSTVDDEGVIDTEIVGSGRVTEAHAVGERIALVGPTQIVIVDTANPKAEPVTVPIDRSNTVTPVPTDGALRLLIGAPTGGNVVIVDVGDGSVIDVGAAVEEASPSSSPLMFVENARWAADGSSFAIADASNFQTIVVQPGLEGVTFLPDQPVAVGGELVATSQTVGLQADIALVDLQRRNHAAVPSEIPVGGVMIDDKLVMVSIDGGVFRIERGDEQPRQLATVAVPAGAQMRWLRPALDGERLVIGGDIFQAVIDLDGGTVFTTTFTGSVEIAEPNPAWSCLAIGGGDTYHSLISLESGEQLADLSGLGVTGTSSDGCTVIGERAGITEVVTADGTVRLGQVRAATLGPDGRSVVSTTTTGRTELLTINDDLQLSDPIDLSHAASNNLTVAFLSG